MRHLRLLGVLAACALLAGCGDSNQGEVAGTITVDGEPLLAGSITFVPADGHSPTAGGDVKDGKYSVAVPTGPMKILIRYPKAAGSKKLYNTPNSPEGTIWTEGLPARYNEKTELTFDVKSGRNKKDWELTSK